MLMTKKILLTKAEKITMIRKIINDKKRFHDALINGKDLKEFKRLFSQPL